MLERQREAVTRRGFVAGAAGAGTAVGVRGRHPRAGHYDPRARFQSLGRRGRRRRRPGGTDRCPAAGGSRAFGGCARGPRPSWGPRPRITTSAAATYPRLAGPSWDRLSTTCRRWRASCASAPSPSMTAARTSTPRRGVASSTATAARSGAHRLTQPSPLSWPAPCSSSTSSRPRSRFMRRGRRPAPAISTVKPSSHTWTSARPLQPSGRWSAPPWPDLRRRDARDLAPVRALLHRRLRGRQAPWDVSAQLQHAGRSPGNPSRRRLAGAGPQARRRSGPAGCARRACAADRADPPRGDRQCRRHHRQRAASDRCHPADPGRSDQLRRRFCPSNETSSPSASAKGP